MGGKADRLSPKEKAVKTDLRRSRFPYEYILDFNGKKAAIRCGYSPKTAEAQASRLLRIDKVAEKIQELIEKKNAEALMSAEEADRRLSSLARVNFKDYYDDNGDFKPIKKLTDDQAYCLKEVTLIETSLGSQIKVKTTDPHAALRTVFERRGLLKQQLDITGKIDVVEIIKFVQGT